MAPLTARTRWIACALAAIAALGLALRLAGVRYGLPAVYNPDEVAIMSRALAFAKGDLNPHNFLYPSLFFYVLFGWIGVSFVVARLFGVVASLQAFQTQFFLDPSMVYTAGRVLAVLCGTATIVLVYRLAARLFGRTAGVLAALFLAVAPFHVRDSHYVKHDVPATLAIVVCMLAIVRLWQSRNAPADSSSAQPMAAGSVRDRAAVWPAALLVGLACSIHYYTVFLVVPLALAAAATTPTPGWRTALRRLAAAGMTSTAAFLLTSPFILAEPATAWRDITANRQIVVDRAVDAAGGWFAGLGTYARMLWLDAVGWPVVLLALAGAARLLARSPREAILVLSFPVAFLIFIANTVPATRYLNPVLPFVSVLAGSALAGLVRAAAVRASGRRSSGARSLQPLRWTIAALAAAAAAPGLLASLRADLFFRQVDTRTLALQYIERQIAPGSTILVQPYSVPLRQSRDSLIESLRANLGGLDRVPAKFALQLALSPYPEPAYRLIFVGDGGLDAEKVYVSYRAFESSRDLQPIRALGVRYVAVKRYNRPDPSTRAFLDALAAGADRLAVFSPYRAELPAEMTTTVEPFLHNTDARIVPSLERPGPLIELWQLHDPDTPAT